MSASSSTLTPSLTKQEDVPPPALVVSAMSKLLAPTSSLATPRWKQLKQQNQIQPTTISSKSSNTHATTIISDSAIRVDGSYDSLDSRRFASNGFDKKKKSVKEKFSWKRFASPKSQQSQKHHLMKQHQLQQEQEQRRQDDDEYAITQQEESRIIAIPFGDSIDDRMVRFRQQATESVRSVYE
jgi:hypothetical protein